jgi:hypothetical protein
LKHVGRIGSEPKHLVKATTKIINADIIPRGDDLHSQGRACERLGIVRAMGATSRLATAFRTTATAQPIATEIGPSPSADILEEPTKNHLRTETSSGPVSDRDLDTIFQKTLASPFRRVYCQPRNPRVLIDLTKDDKPKTLIRPVCEYLKIPLGLGANS